VEIDYCPKCRGVWLDRGELDKIIERSLTQTAPAPPPRQDVYREHGGDSHYDKHGQQSGHGRKRGFLGDLFD
jgi:Zn-finger nucleic acid-binding protein